ncbi:MAG: bifunctional demethylmenaquinone methyltransferase/2-methoxy-6-polyprenyl-1,4-benzoquinol methylase UbiE [Ignavibacteria bacterium]|nr:bifunctional demethylmenaquinone methyltransferase/2-methoxy-6-polyprenyl-1,4-benzoquinol methylase UbiE [Ignavibacteria bacterium]
MTEKRQQVKRIFDSISGSYDFLNHFLSAGIDYYWRYKALKMTGINKYSSVLDIASGTGDFAIAACKYKPENIFGADLSANMLKVFNSKAKWSIGKTVQMACEFLPFKNNSFTNVTVAFGVRNFYDLKTSFSNIYRIILPGGKFTILEFKLPENVFIRWVYLFYFQNILPLLGRMVSKNKEAYTYLPDSVKKFYEEINLPELLKTSGFKSIVCKSLTFGIVQVIIASK